MGYEVEIKAHAYPELKGVIDSFTGSEGVFVSKKDIYYAEKGDVSPRFRIRKENEKLVITVKKNNRINGVECNEELEFEHTPASDLSTMEKMAEYLGYEVFIHKSKEGWHWHFENVHIELLDVHLLGWFLEMEIISTKSSHEENADNILKLYALLESFGLSRCDIEGRSYQIMLQDALDNQLLCKNIEQ